MAQKVMLRIGSPTTGDPVKGDLDDSKMLLSPKKPQIDQNLDLRDRLASLVGAGNNINPDDKAALYGDLKRLLGDAKAQKVIEHAYIFNNRQDVQKLPIEEKLNSFYTMGSRDPEVMEIIGRTKNLGYGILPGFRNSVSKLNETLAGHLPTAPTTSIDPELQRKVLLKIKK